MVALADRRRTITSPSYTPGDDEDSDEPDGPGGGVDLGGVAGDSDPSDAPGAGGGSQDSSGGGGRFSDDSEPSGVAPGSRGGGSGGGGSGDSGDTDEPDGPGGGVDLGGVAGRSAPSDAPGADDGDTRDTSGGAGRGPSSGGDGQTPDETPGPGPGTPGGLGDADPGGGGGDRLRDRLGGAIGTVRDRVTRADANEEIADRATTGGLLSERGESAGLLPPEATASVPGRDDAAVDISETRLRAFSDDAARFGEDLDVGAVFSSPADPLGSGGDIESGRPVGSGDPAGENPAENFIEGGGELFAVAGPAAATRTETALEAGQAAPGIAQDFETDTIAETATATGRDRAAETVARAQANPAEFAGGAVAGAAIGAGVLGRGRTGSLRDAARAELDPRIGPFGETLESRTVSRFLDDDRGQAQLTGLSRQRDPRGSDGEDTDPAGGDDLGPDIGPFDRSDSRLFDPNRDFDDDLGGMQDAPDPVDPTAAESRQDIGGGVSGRGDPETAPGVDADSFSDRGFGDFDGFDRRFDRRSDDTLDPDTDATTPGLNADAIAGGGVGAAAGVFGGGLDADAGPDVGLFDGRLAPPGVDTDPDVGGGIDVFGGADVGGDIGQDTPQDTGQDTPQDTPDLFDPTRSDPGRDTERDTGRDPGRDPGRDRERTDPSDVDLPIELDADGSAASGAGAFGVSSEVFDTGVAQSLDEFFGRL